MTESDKPAVGKPFVKIDSVPYADEFKEYIKDNRIPVYLGLNAVDAGHYMDFMQKQRLKRQRKCSIFSSD